MADASAVSHTKDIKKDISRVLRDKGHTVRKVVRVFAPGDEGAFGRYVAGEFVKYTTAEFVNILNEPRTAIFWTEKKDDRVRTFPGWQGTKSWDPEAKEEVPS